MSGTGMLVLGVVLGLAIAAAIAAWIWIRVTRGWDKKPSQEEIRERLGEVWKP